MPRSFIKSNTRKASPASVAGLAAKRNGQAAEDILEHTAARLLHAGLAEINKRYEPYKRVSSGAGSTFRGCYLGKSGCDYEIHLMNGKSGHMEVKSREGERIDISAIDETQTAQLLRRLEWGQLALVLVRLQGSWYLVDFRRWLFDVQGKPYDRKSHNVKQLNEIGVLLDTIGSCLMLEDGLRKLGYL